MNLFSSLTKHQFNVLAAIFLTYLAIWTDTAFGVFSYVGLGALKVSLLYRLLITVSILIFMYTFQSLMAWYLKIIMLLWGILVVMLTWPAGDFELVNQVNHILRIIFPFGLGMLIAYLIKSSSTNDVRFMTRLIEKGTGHYGWIAGLFIIISATLGIGLESYGDHAFGVKSFYIAGNDTGLAMLLALCLLFLVLYHRTTLRTFLPVVLCLGGLILMGTKAGWAGSVLVVFVYFCIFMVLKKPKRISGVIIKLTAVIGVVGITTATTVLITENYEQVKFQIDQFQALAAGENPREKLISSADYQLMDYPGHVGLIGGGERFNQGIGERYFITFNNIHSTDTSKPVEQDWYDLRGHYGIPFALLVTFGHVMIWLVAVRNFVVLPSVTNMTYALAVSLYLGHAMIAGHAFFSSQAGGVAGIIYGLVLARVRQKC